MERNKASGPLSPVPNAKRKQTPTRRPRSVNTRRKLTGELAHRLREDSRQGIVPNTAEAAKAQDPLAAFFSFEPAVTLMALDAGI